MYGFQYLWPLACSLFTSEEHKTIYLSIVQLDGLAVYVVWGVTFLNMMTCFSYVMKLKPVKYLVSLNNVKILSRNLSFSSCHIFFPSMDWFNSLFQKSTQNTTYTEMNRLVHLYASNSLKAEAITAAGDDLRKLSFTTASQLADENLGFRQWCWAYLAGLKEDNDAQPFYQAVCRDFTWPQLGKCSRSFLLGIQYWEI